MTGLEVTMQMEREILAPTVAEFTSMSLVHKFSRYDTTRPWHCKYNSERSLLLAITTTVYTPSSSMRSPVMPQIMLPPIEQLADCMLRQHVVGQSLKAYVHMAVVWSKVADWIHRCVQFNHSSDSQLLCLNISWYTCRQGDFWIACDYCDTWYDGKCVQVRDSLCIMSYNMINVLLLLYPFDTPAI